eukprot:CAMPEP_0116873918 /NCGR_PEP_ID=MMETSP0463-20121206/5253_1 /TAXON_ID=181622 /ORGANISM="Strombidinopsis sp, Strain SopsisLIS2011" /LENGTH=47 /DNA_ID= /DNA_START= /DNA_END= /DNA_ORIENTATION=
MGTWQLDGYTETWISDDEQDVRRLAVCLNMTNFEPPSEVYITMFAQI